MSIFTGLGVAIVTPFKNGKIDFESLFNIIDFQINKGVKAIILAGTTGEGSTLSIKEKEELFDKSMTYIKNRAKCIASVGSNDTLKSVELVKIADSFGVDGLLAITPYYNKGNNNGIIKHFEKISNNSLSPIIAYNVPSRTGVNISVDLLKEISRIDNIVGLKEANPDISEVIEKFNVVDDSFYIYSGNDDLNVPIMAMGGKGAISVLGNIIPSVMSEICNMCLQDNIEKAAALTKRYNKFITSMFIEVNPIPIKTALYYKKLIKNDELRLPLAKMSEKNEKYIYKLVDEYVS